MAGTDYLTLSGVDAYWTPFVGSAFTTEVAFGLIDEMNLNVTLEELTHISRACGSVGSADKIVVSKTDITADITSPEISPIMLSRAFGGTLTETAVTAGTATEDAVTITDLDTEYNLTLRHISSGVEVWDTTGQTGVQYTETTDYIIDYDKGTIQGVTGGAITALDEVFVTFDNVAYNSWTISAFDGTTATGKLRLEACAVEGMDIEYTFEKVTLGLSGAFGVVSAEDFASIPLKATMLADTLITDPNKSKTVNIKGDDLFDI